MRTRRNETAKMARNRLSNFKLFLVAALVLTTVTAVGFPSPLLTATSAYATTPSTVAFDFDAGSPPPSLYQSTPFYYLMSDGFTARFSSPSDPVSPAFSVQSYQTIPPGYDLSMFSGQFLFDNKQSRDYLDIEFNAYLYSIDLTFATVQPYGGPTEQPCYINLTAYINSIENQVGWTWARGVQSTQNTQGTLSFDSSDQPFNLVRIWIPYQPAPVSVTDFFVDNIVITATPTPDITPPVTTLSLSGTLANHDWYTSNVEVSLSATDDSSGVAKTEFSFDNVAWTTYTNSFSIANEGTTVVYYRSTDAIGNVEDTQTQVVKIDKTTPAGSIVIDSEAASTTSTSVTLTLTSNDAFSGVSEVRYSNDGVWDTESWDTPSTTKTWTLTAGYSTKVVYYQIIDNAGWTSTYQDSILLEAPPTVDTAKPVANAGLDQAATEDTLVTLDGSASTDNVAVTTYTWAFTDETSQTLTGIRPTYTFNSPGVYTITLNVTDAAGNWATDTVIIEILDTTNPVANAGQDRTVNVGTPVSFDAEASSDNVGIVKYEWDCGDGTNHTGETVFHTFNATGTYTITLTVEDAAGNAATHSIKVTVVLPPPLLSDPTSQLWTILAVMAIGVGATAVLFLRKRK